MARLSDAYIGPEGLPVVKYMSDTGEVDEVTFSRSDALSLAGQLIQAVQVALADRGE